MSSHLWWVHAHYSPQLFERWMYVSSPLLSHTPPQVKNRYPRMRHMEDVVWCSWKVYAIVSQSTLGCLIAVFIWCNYLTILYRTSLYINVVTFVSVPWVIICVRLGPSTLGDYLAPGFWCPWNPSVTPTTTIQVIQAFHSLHSIQEQRIHSKATFKAFNLLQVS
jgi:hypothetical protein